MHLFTWDEAKRLSNLSKHGIDFFRAATVFKGKHFIVPSDRNNEQRWKAIGYAEETLIAVAYTHREETIRIISARKARLAEKRKYQELFGAGD